MTWQESSETGDALTLDRYNVEMKITLHPTAHLVRVWFVFVALWLAIAWSGPAAEAAPSSGNGSDETPSTDAATSAPEKEVKEGHSYHGEAFNEGPRQAAYLMPGTGDVRFPVESEHADVQAYINQGVGQLHGFWYFEAERTFRQAAALDPDCAAAYWGMAMANSNNKDRAKGFVKEAMDRKDNASDRVRRYIEALDRLLAAEDAKKGSDRYLDDLEKIVYDYPDDIEAKAFIAVHLWEGRRTGQKIRSHLAVDALIDQVLHVNPYHPAHHYRIHLWDNEKPERALESASLCGQSAPNIAHMWHMPGHIYSRLKRYPDAVWQQEASARTDHAQMMRDGLLPDQIHNFAHNNEWLIRNLVHIGRLDDGLDLAMNMVSLPRHPKYNVLSKGGCSASYGRQRLLQVLETGEMWRETLRLADAGVLERGESMSHQVEWLRAIGRAHHRLGHSDQRDEMIAELAKLKSEQEAERETKREEAKQKVEAKYKTAAETEADAEAEADIAEGNAESGAESDAEPADANSGSDADSDSDEEANPDDESTSDSQAKDAKKTDQEIEKEVEKAMRSASRPFDGDIRRIERGLDELEGYAAADRGEFDEALKRLEKAGGETKFYRAQLLLQQGETDKAIKLLKDDVKGHEQETIPLANLTYLQWTSGEMEEATNNFEALREMSAYLDIRAVPFARLSGLAATLEWPRDWRVDPVASDDVGQRPELSMLGPFRWQPTVAPSWKLVNAHGDLVALDDYRGKPVVVIFYLGFGCLHCAEQLHEFGPQAAAFRDAGIELVAISSDDADGLQKSLEAYDGEIPFPLLANDKLDVFRSYRVFDDFEDQPLHGTFVIDAEGKVRWHDISYEPFMDPKFVLEEAKRLLEADASSTKTMPVPRTADSTAPPKTAAR